MVEPTPSHRPLFPVPPIRPALALVALLAGCGDTPAAPPPPSSTTTVPARDCSPAPLPDGLTLPGGDPEAASLALTRALYRCADVVALASAGDPGHAWRAAEAGGPVLLVTGEPDPATLDELRRLSPRRLVLAGIDPATVPAGDVEVEVVTLRRQPPDIPGATERDDVWLVGPGGEGVLPAVAAAGGDPIVLSGTDARALDAASRGVLQQARAVAVAGEVEAWTLAAARGPLTLPGGGLLLFPGRRLVALYGHPGAPVLGVLGEQGPAEAAARAAGFTAGYDADGLSVVPAFEIIATVASASPGDDGDFSAEASVDELRPWVETAADHGLYVVLDLQPGRTDFLTQARRYEELLRLPHVGLALDPEWRLGPDEMHLRQIGSVGAAEINEVARWLAGIVREEALPQKLLLLHQFRLSMITDRHLVETPPELAVVVQMDGQGPQATKRETWRAITAGAADAGWRWGWKNFLDEDDRVATPAEVIGLDPSPVYVSFQ